VSGFATACRCCCSGGSTAVSNSCGSTVPPHPPLIPLSQPSMRMRPLTSRSPNSVIGSCSCRSISRTLSSSVGTRVARIFRRSSNSASSFSCSSRSRRLACVLLCVCRYVCVVLRMCDHGSGCLCGRSRGWRTAAESSESSNSANAARYSACIWCAASSPHTTIIIAVSIQHEPP